MVDMKFITYFKKLLEIISLSNQAFGKYKWQIVILTLLGFLSGILEGVGINTVIPLFSVIMGQTGQEMDVISKYIKAGFNYFNVDFSLKYLLLFIILLFVLKAIIVIIFSYVEVRISSNYTKKTREDLFEKTLSAKWPYLLKQKLGHLEKVLMINVERSKDLFVLLSIMIMGFTSLIAYTLVAVNISSKTTLITFGLGGAVFFIFKPLIRRTRRISRDLEKLNRDVSHHVNENVLGMKTVKASRVDKAILDKARDYFDRLRIINIKAHVLSIFSSSLIEPFSVIFVAGLFAVFYKLGDFNFAALLAVLYLAKRMFGYITELQQNFIGMNAAVPYVKSVLDCQEQAGRAKEEDRGKKPFVFNNCLEFQNVVFSYPEKGDVLKGVSFKLNRGEMVGLIGPSGAGKTTLVDLVLRLFEPDKGKIALDGVDIKEISLNEWRKSIGYVSQDIFLINDTIANNIRFYKSSITGKDIDKAARMANIYDDIMECPDGFQTIVGEQGKRFSGGQRQRIIIARVLARKPQLLVLDEATSALDNQSEKKVQEVIKGLKGKVTVFVIAHRLSTVINSDRLIAIEHGRIVEQGTPQELLKNQESYFSRVYHLK